MNQRSREVAQRMLIKLSAEKYIQWKKKWQRVIFNDEKRFTLDEPDGYQYYFHDLRKETQSLSCRQAGGERIMAWAGIGYYGSTEIKFIIGKMKSLGYINLIDFRRRNIQILDGPAKLLNLNIVENCWAQLVELYRVYVSTKGR